MKSRLAKIISSILVAVLLIALVLVLFKKGYINQFEAAYFPCRQPITYSIGEFDSQFGISQNDFLKAVDEAAHIWEDPVHKTLFQYSPAGAMKINLVYDYRQQDTQRLEQLGLTINDDQATYNKLKAQYDTTRSEYYTEKAAIDKTLSDYNAAKAQYEAQVQYWNSRGGAPKTEYEKLQQQKDQLNAEAAQIQSRENDFNQMVDNLNALANTLNRLASELNLNVSDYNQIGTDAGGEFQEGLYKSDVTGTEIDIYQFENQSKLVRVLAHELGHSLGLEHVNDPNAIMYRLNQGQNDKLTSTDLDELIKHCGL